MPCIGSLCVVETQQGTVGRVDHLRDGAGRALKPERDGVLRHRKSVGKRSGDIFWRIAWGFRRRADHRTEQHDEQAQLCCYALSLPTAEIDWTSHTLPLRDLENDQLIAIDLNTGIAT